MAFLLLTCNRKFQSSNYRLVCLVYQPVRNVKESTQTKTDLFLPFIRIARATEEFIRYVFPGSIECVIQSISRFKLKTHFQGRRLIVIKRTRPTHFSEDRCKISLLLAFNLPGMRHC